jgi:anti-anti-sigma regulatory factor
MNRFRLDSSYARGTLRLLLHGVFDGSSAWEVRHALAGADAARVIIDFSGVEEAWEFGAAVLSAGIKGLDRSRIGFANVPEKVSRALALFGTPVEAESDWELAWPWMAASADRA